MPLANPGQPRKEISGTTLWQAHRFPGAFGLRQPAAAFPWPACWPGFPGACTPEDIPLPVRAMAKGNLISRDEYLQGELVSEIRHEYVAGNVHAMSGGTLKPWRNSTGMSCE